MLLANALFSQEDVQFGLLPKINVSTKLSENYKWVNSIESRELIYDNQWKLTHGLIDIASIVSIKLASDQSFNVGYLVRFRNGGVAHRFIQQYNIVTLADGYRLAHRLGLDQQFQSGESSIYRIRYRIIYEKPLEGNKIDVKEFYLKLGVEALHNFTKEDLELRGLPFVGYRMSEDDKIELGFDYRRGGILSGLSSNTSWLRVTWYTNF